MKGKVLLFAVGKNNIIADEILESLKQKAISDSIDENEIVIKKWIEDRRKKEGFIEIIKEIEKDSEIKAVYISSQNDLSFNLGKIFLYKQRLSDLNITVRTLED